VLIFGMMVVLSIVAALVTLHSNSVTRSATTLQTEIAHHSSEMRVNLEHLRADCRLALAHFEDADKDVLLASVRELTEEILQVVRPLGDNCRQLDLREQVRVLEEELRDLGAIREEVLGSYPLKRRSLAALDENARAVRNALLGLSGQATEAVDERLDEAGRLDRIAAVALLLVLLLALFGSGLVVSDALNETLGAFDLSDELAVVAETAQFRHRMLKFCSESTPIREWELRLHQVLNEKRTHITFEALASSGDEQVYLWGKCYRWTGLVKGLQRIFEPAFGKATWRALCIMHTASLPAPFPVTWRKIKRGPFNVGYILLAEHVGEAEPLKPFLKNEFVLLNPERRRGLLRRLADYYNRWHELGFHSFTPRYLHATGLDRTGETDLDLYLFDLDKIGITEGTPGWWHRRCVQHDNRKLCRLLRDYVTREELERCRQRLRDEAPFAQ
jgi:hypothetical protein